LEYSIAKDAAFCLCCYLFRLENVGSGGRTSFVGEDYRCWKLKKSFDDHVGDSNSLHKEAYKRCMNLMNQRQNIHTVIERQSVKDGVNYRIQLAATIDTIQLILRQDLAFHGHDEFENSSNVGNFIELLRFLKDHNEKIKGVIFDNAPQNQKLVAPTIQKDIVNACAEMSLNQEMSFARPCDTRWISHYKTLTNLLNFFSVTIEVLEIIEDGKDAKKQAEASGFVEEMRTFNFVFIRYHL
jgi:Domain of unknown function (DUF4371)